jgi:hypothetical protein
MIMNDSAAIKYLIFAAALVCAVIGVSYALEGFAIVRKGATSQELREDVEIKTFSKIDSALGAEVAFAPFSYSGDFKTPFRSDTKRAARYGRRSPSKPAYTRPKLRLKGILAKENPLAIIQDESGKSYICKKGDAVQEQLVANIEAGVVTLRDRSGDYSLRVDEER